MWSWWWWSSSSFMIMIIIYDHDHDDLINHDDYDDHHHRHHHHHIAPLSTTTITTTQWYNLQVMSTNIYLSHILRYIMTNSWPYRGQLWQNIRKLELMRIYCSTNMLTVLKYLQGKVFFWVGKWGADLWPMGMAYPSFTPGG